LDIKKEKIEQCGLSFTLEPFFCSMLKLLYQQKLRNLLDKTRIKIDTDKGRLMMGTVDETDSLEYGEVFVQYSKNIDSPQTVKVIREGPVVVTKNPCLHPGDVRKLTAINKRELNHMVDCIVFPAKGKRPHPNEISGSDLDGDMYFVCWEEILIPPSDNKEPMDYRPEGKLLTRNQITERDTFEYIGKYIQSAQLGVIANAHLVHADAQKSGIFSKPCKELAMVHSEAVDAPKSGHCPTIPFELRPQSYPHYMLKKDKTVYTSKHIIAKLFDQCCAIDHALLYNRANQIDLDKDFEVVGYEEYLNQARTILDEYYQQMQSLIDRFDLESEIEAWTGQILSTKKRNGSYEIAKKVNGPMMELKKKIMRIFNQEFENHTGDSNFRNMSKQKKVSAIYRVTYERAKNNQGKYDMLGLPWIFHEILVCIKSENIKKREYQIHTEPMSLLHKLSLELRNKSRYPHAGILQQPFEVYKKMCRILIEHKIAVKLVLFGSTITAINNVSSTVDILIVSENLQSTSSDIFRSAMDVILNCRTNNPNEKAYLPHGQRKFVLNMFDSKVCLFLDLKCLQRTAYISAALCNNKWMIPCVKVVTEWASQDKNKSMFGSGSRCLLSIEDIMLMFFYFVLNVSKYGKEISLADLKKVTELLMQNHFQHCPIVTCNHFDTDSRMHEKGNVESLNCPDTSIAKEAEMVFLYFRYYGSNRQTSSILFHNIPDPSIPDKQVQLLTLKEEQCLQLSDRMTQAYHEFAHAMSINNFLHINQIADDHLDINLPSQVSAYIAFSSVYQEQKLKQDSCADSVTIRLKKFRNGTSTLMLEAWGDSSALIIINQSVQDLIKVAIMMTKSGDIKPRIMGEEAFHLAFEGCPSDDAIISIEPYIGPCQQNHDRFVRHVPRLLQPSESQAAFEKMLYAFQRQIHLIRQSYDEHCFGDLQVVISYGTYYVTNSHDMQLEENKFINLINMQRESNNEILVTGRNQRGFVNITSNNSGNRHQSGKLNYSETERTDFGRNNESGFRHMNQIAFGRRPSNTTGNRRHSGKTFNLGTESAHLQHEYTQGFVDMNQGASKRSTFNFCGNRQHSRRPFSVQTERNRQHSRRPFSVQTERTQFQYGYDLRVPFSHERGRGVPYTCSPKRGRGYPISHDLEREGAPPFLYGDQASIPFTQDYATSNSNFHESGRAVSPSESYENVSNQFDHLRFSNADSQLEQKSGDYVSSGQQFNNTTSNWASTKSDRGSFYNSTQSQIRPKSSHNNRSVRSAFIPGGTTNETKLKTFLESRNFQITKRLEEYRVTVQLYILGEAKERRQSCINGVLILNENFSFQRLQLPSTKWLVFDTIRGTDSSNNKKHYDVRFKVSSRSDTTNEEVLRTYECEDLLINANRILERHGADVIGVCREYQKRIHFLRHKHLEVYECQDKSRELESSDVFLRQVKIKVNRGNEFSRPKYGKFESIDRDRVEVTCTLPLPDLRELAMSDSDCRSFVEWLWQFGRELGSVII